MLRLQVRILRQFFPKPVRFCSSAVNSKPIQNTKPNSLLQSLWKEFNDITPIINTLKEDEVGNLHFNEWKSRINILNKYQFSNLDCFRMIAKYPLLLKIPLEEFEDTTKLWFAADLGIKNFSLLLFTQPILFDISADAIKERIPLLRTHVRTSTALTQLLINSPNVMFDSWENVTKKLDYLLKVKHFKMGDIITGCALSKSLDFIKFRLELLEKCGIFKPDDTPVHKVNKYDKSSHKNPPLKDILLTNTNDFSKVAKISTEEYAVCRDLFLSNDDYESDSDSEVNGYVLGKQGKKSKQQH